ncbi:MAG: SIR2 family protein, partial [Firmicutes bacterium]|nr:SIR2 family protein [Bacillota bacterium]
PMAVKIGRTKCTDKRKCSACKTSKSKCQNYQQCKNNNFQKCPSERDISSDEFLKIPQVCAVKHGRFYRNTLRNEITLKSNNKKPNIINEIIFDINPKHIITTNYDDLLEKATNYNRDVYKTVISGGDLLKIDDKERYIIKMHGDMNDLDNIVLKEEDYLNYSQNHVLIETYLKSLLTDHTFLFVGYSMGDNNLKLILSWLNYLKKDEEFKSGKSRKKSVKEIRNYIVKLGSSSESKYDKEYYEEYGVGVVDLDGFDCDISKELERSIFKKYKKQYDEWIVNNKFYATRLFNFLYYLVGGGTGGYYLGNIFPINGPPSSLLELNFIPVSAIRDFLKIDAELYGSHLHIKERSRNSYDAISNLLNPNNKHSKNLNLMFSKAGINKICWREHWTDEDDSRKSKDHVTEINVQSNEDFELINLYFENKYDELQKKISRSFPTPEDLFYKVMLFPHRQMFGDEKINEIIDAFSELIENKLRMENSSGKINPDVLFLEYNKRVLNLMTKIENGDWRELTRWVSNIADKSLKKSLEWFCQVVEHDETALFGMKRELEVVVKVFSGGVIRYAYPYGDYNELLSLKARAWGWFFCFFRNHLIFKNSKFLSNVLKPYAEAVICANSSKIEQEKEIFFKTNKFEPYEIGMFELEILTKHVEAEKLHEWIDKYKVNKLKIKKEILVKLFKNLCNSLLSEEEDLDRIQLKEYLHNYAIILNCSCSDIDNEEVIELFVELFERKTQLFFNGISLGKTVQFFFNLIRIFSKNASSELKKKIIGALLKGLFQSKDEFQIENNFYAFNLVILDIGKDVEMILNHEFKDRIDYENILMGYLKYSFLNEEEKAKYGEEINKKENWQHFIGYQNSRLFFELMDANILLYSEDLADFLEDVLLKEKDEERKGKISFPDYHLMKLQVIAILSLDNKFKNLERFQKYDYDPIEFLINKEKFDFSKVDLCNFVWQYFFKKPELVKYFVSNKEILISNYQKAKEQGRNVENAKKTISRFLLDDDEFWNWRG